VAKYALVAALLVERAKPFDATSEFVAPALVDGISRSIRMPELATLFGQMVLCSTASRPYASSSNCRTLITHGTNS
jgi:hypothetical protein